MNIVSKLTIVAMVLCVIFPVCSGKDILERSRKIARNFTDQQKYSIINTINSGMNGESKKVIDNAYNLVWQALSKMGIKTVNRIVEKGFYIINDENVVVLAAGDDSVDSLKFTALYHFAVSESEKIYYMDIFKDANWELVENISSQGDTKFSFSTTGTYTRVDSSETDKGILSMKYLSGRFLLFELKLFSHGETSIISGIITVDESNKAEYSSSLNETNGYCINFYFDSYKNKIILTHERDNAAIVDGVYQYTENRINVKADSAIILLKNLSVALTSLNIYNTPYELKCSGIERDSSSGLDRLIITATYMDTGDVIARFSVAADLSSVYRIDNDFVEPILIFGGVN